MDEKSVSHKPLGSGDHWLKHFSIAMFAASMGLSAPSLVLRRLASNYGWSEWFGHIWGAVSFCVFLVLLCTWVVRMVRFFPAVQGEFTHPIKRNFFPTIPINMIIFSLVAVDLWEPQHAEDGTHNAWFWIGAVLCVGGAVMHFVFAMVIGLIWLGPSPLPSAAMNATTLIPPVANLIMALSLAKYQLTELGWFYWAAGLGLFIAIFAMNLTILITGPSVPDKLLPSFFIWIAPGAIGGIGYRALGGSFDVLYRVLFYFSLFFWAFCILLLFVRIIPWMRREFAVTWWALTFPSSAIAVISYDFAKGVSAATGEEQLVFKIISWVLSVVDFIFVGVCLVTTIIKLARRQLFVPEAPARPHAE